MWGVLRENKPRTLGWQSGGLAHKCSVEAVDSRPPECWQWSALQVGGGIPGNVDGFCPKAVWEQTWILWALTLNSHLPRPAAFREESGSWVQEVISSCSLLLLLPSLTYVILGGSLYYFVLMAQAVFPSPVTAHPPHPAPKPGSITVTLVKNRLRFVTNKDQKLKPLKAQPSLKWCISVSSSVDLF